MARSLSVQHNEKAATSSLFTAFLFLAFGWMALSAITAGAGTTDVEPAGVLDAE